MIRWNRLSLSWGCSACFVAVIAVAGCDKAPPDAAPSHVSAPPYSVEPSREIAAEPVGEVSEPEMAPTAEVTNSDLPLTNEKPAEAEPQAVATPIAPSTQKQPKVALSVPEPPDYVYEPQVLMSQRDADTCLVKTGEPFPVGQLSDLQGEEHSLKELFGEKLTVVVFWSNANRLGREQIQRLEAETVLPFTNTGLNVVAINIGDPSEQIADLLPADRKVDFTILLDPDATFFAKVATGRHPRTYLLDAAGNIVWFDIEYSRSTARDLANAIHVHLGGGKPGDS
ncbi:MAG: redoxin domain-containing protein [Planctomycetota bacterium]